MLTQRNAPSVFPIIPHLIPSRSSVSLLPEPPRPYLRSMKLTISVEFFSCRTKPRASTPMTRYRVLWSPELGGRMVAFAVLFSPSERAGAAPTPFARAHRLSNIPSFHLPTCSHDLHGTMPFKPTPSPRIGWLTSRGVSGVIHSMSP